MNASRRNTTFTNKANHTLTHVVEETYTTESRWKFDKLANSDRLRGREAARAGKNNGFCAP